MSKSNVPMPAARNCWATWRLRGLLRLLPLPWAKMTRAGSSAPRASVPGNCASPAGMRTSISTAAMAISSSCIG